MRYDYDYEYCRVAHHFFICFPFPVPFKLFYYNNRWNEFTSFTTGWRHTHRHTDTDTALMANYMRALFKRLNYKMKPSCVLSSKMRAATSNILRAFNAWNNPLRRAMCAVCVHIMPALDLQFKQMYSFSVGITIFNINANAFLWSFSV